MPPRARCGAIPDAEGNDANSYIVCVALSPETAPAR
jgi:hypothetical protein